MSKTHVTAMRAYVLLGVIIELSIGIWFVHFHELGAWGPMNYLQKVYPEYKSLAVSNKFEGNYLTLNHRRDKENASLVFVNHDPPFV